MRKKGKVIWAWLFFGYGIWMLWLLFGQRLGTGAADAYGQQLFQNLNLTPFGTIRRFWRVLTHFYDPQMRRHAAVNLAGNVVMFMPLGFFLPLIWKKTEKLWQVLLLGTGVILGVELLQLVTLLGCCDIDDLILNLLGILAGYGLWKLIGKKSPE